MRVTEKHAGTEGGVGTGPEVRAGEVGQGQEVVLTSPTTKAQPGHVMPMGTGWSATPSKTAEGEPARGRGQGPWAIGSTWIATGGPSWSI